jgi:hypothetical protein
MNSMDAIANHERTLPVTSRPNNLLGKSSIFPNCLLLFNALLATALAILIGFYIQKLSHIAELENDLKMNYKRIFEEQTKNNQTIDKLNDRLKELENEKSKKNMINFFS